MAKINIPGRLHSVETGNIVTGADEVFDDNMELKQQAINQQVDEAVTQLESSTSAMADRIEQVAHMKDKSVGLFSTLASLQAAHPTPEVGDWALVGDADPFAVYECSTAGTWTATGGTYSAGEIDLADYTTKAEFDELDAVVNGGSSEVTATTTWNESSMIYADTGDKVDASNNYYNASNFIQIPNGIVNVRLLALVIKPGGGFNTHAGLAFYDSSQTYISGIAREEYDHGGTAVAGMAERTYPVPSGARYMRTTCMTSQEGNWFCYFISSTDSGLVGRMNDAELNIDAAAELAQEAYDLAEKGGKIQPSHDVYRHATDPDAPLNYTSAQRGRAVYTTVFSEDVTFNRFIVKAVKASAADTSVAWRLNVFANTNTAYDYIPTRGDGLKGTTLKSGAVTVGDTAADVVVDLGEDITCPAGQQVIIYMIVDGEATIQLGRATTLQDDTHGSVYNSTGEWAGAWVNAYPDANIGYSTCAPVLRYESAIMSREEIDNVIDRKIEEAAITVEDYKILLADSIYCLVGSEVNIYDDTVSLSVDNAGHRSLNYTVEWRTVGNIAGAPVKRTPQGIRIRPMTAGTFQLRCTLLNLRDSVLDTKVITVYAVAKDALSASKNILYLGASYTKPTNQIVYNILSGSDTYNTAEGVGTKRYTGTCPTFWGTQGSGDAKCEGRGGWTWGSFHNGGDPVYNPDTDSYEYDTDSPIIDPSTGEVSASYYRSSLGMGDTKFDLIIFQLGGNENVRAIGAQPKTVEQYKAEMRKWLSPMDDIVRNFHEDSPDAKIVLILPRNYDNRWTGYGETVNAYFNHWEKNKASYAMCLLYYEWFESYVALGGTNVVLSNSNFCLDRFYGMQLLKVPVNDRWAKNAGGGREMFVTNVAHPSPVGYGQIADELAAEVAGRLSTIPTAAPTGYQSDGYYGNADEEVVNGKGIHFDAVLNAAVETQLGTLTNEAWIVYDIRYNRFLARDKGTYKYYTSFAANSLYMEDGHPKADVIYWLGDVPYMYNGTTLVRLSEFIANVTARLAALENG